MYVYHLKSLGITENINRMGANVSLSISKPTLLIVGEDESFYIKMKHYFQTNYTLLFCKTFSKASAIIHSQNSPAIGVVIANVAHINNPDLKSFLYDIRKNQNPEIICAYQPSIHTQDDVPHIVQLIKWGMHDVLQVDDLYEIFNFVVSRAMDVFSMKLKLVNRSSVGDLGFHLQAFSDFLAERKEKGMPITQKEIEMFLPAQKEFVKRTSQELLRLINSPIYEDFQNITILLADDEKNFRSMTDALLEPYGYTLIEAKSGKEVLEKLLEHHIDIILLDVSFGDMTGDQLVPIIKKAHPHIDIIMVTAFADVELVVNTIKSGVFDYVVKGRLQKLIPQKIAQLIQYRVFKSILEIK